jgi:putative membrane-bound dehydrogenase-like protein
MPVGLAQVDITPQYPIRLNGFGSRRTESEGVRQRIWAKALAAGSDTSGPAVLIAIDTLAVPDSLVNRLAQQLRPAGVRRERLALTATHTHTGPMIRDVSPTIFGMPIPPEHQAHIDQYSSELAEKLVQVAQAALTDRRPARLGFVIGSVKFATNRRTRGGPVDHDLPMLTVRAPDGALRGVVVSYACHCVTLSDNQISGDWAGYAAEAIERRNPGCTALISIGCGADANPNSGVTGGRSDIAEAQGHEIAAEVQRLLGLPAVPVNGPLVSKLEHINLPLAPLPSLQEWQRRAKDVGAVGHHARVNLARLERTEPLPTAIRYPIQTWAFDDSLAILFLPGEVVVDYSIRLKRELDGNRLWINSYANGCPGYVPSERILREGGYEGGGAMIYYDLPAPYAPGLEKKIIDAVKQQLDDKFKAPIDASRTQGVLPRSPLRSLAALRVKSGFVADLVVSEPLVASPVAIDFGPDGTLWVAEMFDYPAGVDGDYQPGGRIKLLSDGNGDGRFDNATVFLDDIPFPTGVTVWRNGVLVCAAPDILFAEDTDGDGRADVVRKVFSGFGTENFQARVNSLRYGLDGWVYGSCGLFGGTIRNETGRSTDLGNRDFRIKPDFGQIEPVTGISQQGRCRDDWGNWFGCDNSTLIRHYPVDDRYVRRNVLVAPPRTADFAHTGPDPNRLFPISQPVLFPLSGSANYVTAACGLEIYRDDLLGQEYAGDSFTCEPVCNVVHHLDIKPHGLTFSGGRPGDENQFEFVASSDCWFRPVQVRTGPDGSLWIVDMYRYVIEHPRWIPPATVAALDVRAGADMGRIYRVYPETWSGPKWPARTWPKRGPASLPVGPDFKGLSTQQLVVALESSNGWQRDMAQQQLVWRGDRAAIPLLRQAAVNSMRPQTRLHALCTLQLLAAIDDETVIAALGDRHPGIRRQAIRIAEPRIQQPSVGAKLAPMTIDADAQVRLQLAYSLGFWHDDRAFDALARLLLDHSDDEYLRSAVLSSVHVGNVARVLEAAMKDKRHTAATTAVSHLMALAATIGDDRTFERVIELAAGDRLAVAAAERFRLMTHVLDAMERRGLSLDRIPNASARGRIEATFAAAREIAVDSNATEAHRLAALRLIGRGGRSGEEDLTAPVELLGPHSSPAIQEAVLEALGRSASQKTQQLLLLRWKSQTPALRGRIADVLLAREVGTRALLDGLESGEISAADFDATRRQRLLELADPSLRQRAERVFAAINPDRAKVVEEYRSVTQLRGEPLRGKAVFAKECAGCHQFDGVGHAVGQNLTALGNRAPEALLIAVLDPSRQVDGRYVAYVAALRDGRTLAGLLAHETSTSITLRGQDGKEDVILRADLETLRSTGKSMMPDGIERDVSRQDLADLFAFLATAASPPTLDPHHVSAADYAKRILDDAVPDAERSAIIQSQPQIAVELIAAMTADLSYGTDAAGNEEYRRIPWIWRIAVAAGKRNQPDQLRRILDAALPRRDETLRDWQAVVIGGGIINGLTQTGVWPRERILELIEKQVHLMERWERTIELAARMADDERVRVPTRYDALRILGCDTWENRGRQLGKYLAKGTHDELQMGAVSALGDLRAAEVVPLLLSGLEHFSAHNRELALDALIRDEARVAVLLDAVADGTLKAKQIGPTRRSRLLNHPNKELRTRAHKLLASNR